MHSVIFISIRNIESKRNIEQNKFTNCNNLFPNPIDLLRDHFCLSPLKIWHQDGCYNRTTLYATKVKKCCNGVKQMKLI